MVAGDRLPDRIGIGVLAKVFPPELVDRVVDEAGVREQRKRTLPARVVVYLLLAMVLFFQSGYGEVWNKLVQGLEWARQFRVRVALGMQPSTARSQPAFIPSSINLPILSISSWVGGAFLSTVL